MQGNPEWNMVIRRLTPSDSSCYQTLRLAALRDAPSAFGSSYEEEKDFPPDLIQSRLAAKRDGGVFGAFEGTSLVGLVALVRDKGQKREHKALIFGMYVIPGARGKGTGRALLSEALALARSVPAIRQVNLSVNATNTPAIHLYESVGFKTYGCEPSALFVDGELHDEIHMILQLTTA